VPPAIGHRVEDLFRQAPRLGPAGEEGWEAQVNGASQSKPAVCGRADSPVHSLSRQRSSQNAAQRSRLLDVERL